MKKAFTLLCMFMVLKAYCPELAPLALARIRYADTQQEITYSSINQLCYKNLRAHWYERLQDALREHHKARQQYQQIKSRTLILAAIPLLTSKIDQHIPENFQKLPAHALKDL